MSRNHEPETMKTILTTLATFAALMACSAYATVPPDNLPQAPAYAPPSAATPDLSAADAVQGVCYFQDMAAPDAYAIQEQSRAYRPAPRFPDYYLPPSYFYGVQGRTAYTDSLRECRAIPRRK